jgi:hypothetical protein
MLSQVTSESTQRTSQLALVGNIAFDLTLVIITMGAAWLWIQDPIAKITAEVMLLISNGTAISVFHRPPKGVSLDSFKLWLLYFAGAATIALVFSRLEPVWWNFAVLFLRGHQEQALNLLDTKPHGNLPMFVGLFGMYGALAGLIRLALKRLFRILIP